MVNGMGKYILRGLRRLAAGGLGMGALLSLLGPAGSALAQEPPVTFTPTADAYVLDGEMENFIRSAAPSFEIVATVGGERRPLVLQAVANPATGETVGSTSLFEATADWLKTTPSFDAVLTTLDIRGSVFSAVPFNFPKGNDKD